MSLPTISSRPKPPPVASPFRDLTTSIRNFLPIFVYPLQTGQPLPNHGVESIAISSLDEESIVPPTTPVAPVRRESLPPAHASSSRLPSRSARQAHQNQGEVQEACATNKNQGITALVLLIDAEVNSIDGLEKCVVLLLKITININYYNSQL